MKLIDQGEAFSSDLDQSHLLRAVKLFCLCVPLFACVGESHPQVVELEDRRGEIIREIVTKFPDVEKPLKLFRVDVDGKHGGLGDQVGRTVELGQFTDQIVLDRILDGVFLDQLWVEVAENSELIFDQALFLETLPLSLTQHMLRLLAFSRLVNFKSGLSRVATGLYELSKQCGTYKGSLDHSLLTSFTSVFSALNSPSLLL